MFILQMLGVIFIIGFLVGRNNAKKYITKYYELQKIIEAEMQSTKNKQVREALSRVLGITTSFQPTDDQAEESEPNSQNIAQPWQLEPTTETQSQIPAPQVYAEPAHQTIAEVSKPHTDFANKLPATLRSGY